MSFRQAALAALLLAASPAFAVGDEAQRGGRCAGIDSGQERLACYDAIFRLGTGTAALPPAAPAADTPASADERFGAEQVRRPSREEPEAPRSLVAQVREVRETRPNVYRVVLDNGQVWQQMDMDSRFQVEPGDTVEISRGRMGGYRMARQGRGGGSWVRVNRVR